MTSKERMIAAFERRKPDRLPATSHHLMAYFLGKYMGGISDREFFDRFDLDAIDWVVAHRPDEAAGQYCDPGQGEPGFLEARRIVSDSWRFASEEIPGQEYRTVRVTITTPKGSLSTVLQSNEHTTWISEHLVKEKRDVDLIEKFSTAPLCDVEAVNRAADAFGDRGIVRGHVCCFDPYGQPGCWQDAACLVGIERLIMETYDDPRWVHRLLGVLQRRKLTFVRSLAGARYDILELGGGDASTTVISPGLFEEYVAPYDSVLIEAARRAGQRISYHTCGGMMPILEKIAAMGPDAMETFTPPAMGGDADLAEAKRRIGDRVCFIGGFDQFHFFTGCTPEQTRAGVRRCFEAAGDGGGYVLCPSDHFFDADPELVVAYADEAKRCIYR